jgi:hypothetical protein
VKEGVLEIVVRWGCVNVYPLDLVKKRSLLVNIFIIEFVNRRVQLLLAKY